MCYCAHVSNALKPSRTVAGTTVRVQTPTLYSSEPVEMASLAVSGLSSSSAAAATRTTAVRAHATRERAT